MIRKFALLICVLLIISCEKEEFTDLLTKGTWVLVSKLPYTIPETIKFNSDGTYVQEVFLSDNYLSGINTPVFSTYGSNVKLSGDWSLKNNDIQFIHPIINFPEDTAFVSGGDYENGDYKISITPGGAIGGLFGYRYLGITPNDSITDGSFINDSLKLIMGSDMLIHRWVGNDSIVPVNGSNQWTWAIIKLTEDSLVVNSYGEIQRYFNH